jgi:hypothetical protein
VKKIGIMDYWNIGIIVKDWGDGILEYWNSGILEFGLYHYSSVPLFQLDG